jgi:hypothetical protein
MFYEANTGIFSFCLKSFISRRENREKRIAHWTSQSNRNHNVGDHFRNLQFKYSMEEKCFFFNMFH